MLNERGNYWVTALGMSTWKGFGWVGLGDWRLENCGGNGITVRPGV